MSVGAVVVLTSIIATSLTLEYHLSIWTMLIFSIAIAMILCLITSVAYVLLRIPMMVLSIGLVIVYEALTGIVFGGHGVAALAPDTRLLGYQPWCFILVIAAMIVFHIITEYTQYAYSTKLLAGGQAMAVRIGVNEVKNVIQGFLICGFFLGLASMVYISNYGLVEAVSNMGSGTIMFNSLLPVIIGLILANFSCRAVGVAVSVISMKTISYGLFCLGFNSTVQDVVSGTFILVLVIVMGALAMAPEKRRVNARAKALTAIKSA
jgi:ribose transport system permease protein